jgi:hypothetical protein
MADGDMLCRCETHEVAGHIDNILKLLAQHGQGGNIVRDLEDQLSPPEAATWTGARSQLALMLSGRDVWLELRAFHRGLANGRVVTVPQTIRNRGDFASAVAAFAKGEK